MKRRLYFILPNTRLARTVHNELLLARVPEKHMHVIAANDRVDLQDLPQASLWQRSDLAHGLQLGLPVGGLTGLVAGIIAVLSGWISPDYEAKTIMATVLAGIIVGTWASSMIAVNVPNTRHREFEADLRQGHVLFIVDVPVQRVDEITELVTRHHPEAVMRGIEPNIPVFP